MELSPFAPNTAQSLLHAPGAIFVPTMGGRMPVRSDSDTLCPIRTNCHRIAPVLLALSFPTTLARDMGQQLFLKAIPATAKSWRHVARRLLPQSARTWYGGQGGK